MAHTEQSLHKATKVDLLQILSQEFGFKISMFSHQTYYKNTLVKMVLVLQQKRVCLDYTVMQCELTKKEMARQLKMYCGIDFCKHELNYIVRQDIIALYNTLIDGVR